MLYATCDGKNDTCGFDATETLDLYFFSLNTTQTLALSLSLSLVSVLRMVIELWIVTQGMGINVWQYLKHLIALGGGLNLDAVRLNKIEAVT